MNRQLLVSVLTSLQPNFVEQLDDFGGRNYWERYENELECIGRTGHLEDYLNHFMRVYYSTSPEHHAVTDVASTLHEIDPTKYSFKFK